MGRDNTWGQLLYTLEPGEARGKGRIQLVGPGDLMGQDSFGRFGFAWLGGDLKEPCKVCPSATHGYTVASPQGGGIRTTGKWREVTEAQVEGLFCEVALGGGTV